jgi:hypothetical protein
MATPRHCGKWISMTSSLLVLIFLAGFVYGKKKPPVDQPPFEYVAGTEAIERGCDGKLEVLKDSLAFSCPNGSVNLPFSAITLMQYRPDLNPKVARMKIAWKVRPVITKAKQNQYLTLLYNEKDVTHAVVLKVDQPAMRPYLAEIELKTGKSVQVFRSYDDND